MNVTAIQEFKVAEQCVVAEYAGGLAVFDTRINEFYMLNEVGHLVWSAVEAGKSVDTIVDEIIEEYDADAAQVRTDVIVVIEDMKRNGLLERA